jgi:hypothetical protein
MERFLGRSPDSLTWAERRLLTGRWVALERYTPQTTPHRQIEAIGASPAECIAALRGRGLDPARYEFDALTFSA